MASEAVIVIGGDFGQALSMARIDCFSVSEKRFLRESPPAAASLSRSLAAAEAKAAAARTSWGGETSPSFKIIN